MRANRLANTLILLSSFAAFSVYAADQAPAPKAADTRLETIGETPASSKGEMKDCPMHQGKMKCDHQKGEPCPLHKDEKQHGKSHEKCEHMHHG